MKILVVCQYYYPESFKVTDVCEALAADGHDVHVLTGLPNYPTGIVDEEYKGNKHRDEIINGVHVIRCYEHGRGKGAVNLAINYASFCLSAMKRIRKMDKDFDIVFSYQLSPIFMALPARWYKLKRHVPMFLYCADLWPESIKVYIKGESNLIFKCVKRISKMVYKAADRIATQSDVFVDYLEQVHGIAMDRLTHIPNFADEGYLKEDFTPADDACDIMFMGNVGVTQNVESVVTAYAGALKEIKDNGINKKLCLHIVGDGVRLDALKTLAKELDIEDDVKFHGQHPQNEMSDFYKIADACIVSLKADNMVGLTFPAKVQGYMAAGKPVLGMIDGTCRKVINEAGCGMCVGASDVDGFKDIIVKFALDDSKWKEYGDNSRNYFLNNFRKDAHVKAIEEELSKCVEEYKRN